MKLATIESGLTMTRHQVTEEKENGVTGRITKARFVNWNEDANLLVTDSGRMAGKTAFQKVTKLTGREATLGFLDSKVTFNKMGADLLQKSHEGVIKGTLAMDRAFYDKAKGKIYFEVKENDQHSAQREKLKNAKRKDGTLKYTAEEVDEIIADSIGE
jgi:hypothetical protein